MTAQANGDIQEDNDTTRVTLWRFAPGVGHNVNNASGADFAFVEVEFK